MGSKKSLYDDTIKSLRSVRAQRNARERRCPNCQRNGALKQIVFGRKCRWCNFEFGTSEKYTGPGTKPSERRAVGQHQEGGHGQEQESPPDPSAPSRLAE